MAAAGCPKVDRNVGQRIAGGVGDPTDYSARRIEVELHVVPRLIRSKDDWVAGCDIAKRGARESTVKFWEVLAETGRKEVPNALGEHKSIRTVDSGPGRFPRLPLGPVDVNWSSHNRITK